MLHIDRLMFKGFDREERHRIAADLQGELGRLLADPATAGRLACLSHVSSIQVGKEDAGGGKPERSGISAARAIVGGLYQ